MMPTIPAEWQIYMEMIQKLPMFVSLMYVVVMRLTAVSSYMYHHDILTGFSELNHGLACQVVKTQIVPLRCLDRHLSVFFNIQLQCTCTVLIILLHLKCKESSAVI